jgi:hypothetical protein
MQTVYFEEAEPKSSLGAETRIRAKLLCVGDTGCFAMIRYTWYQPCDLPIYVNILPHHCPFQCCLLIAAVVFVVVLSFNNLFPFNGERFNIILRLRSTIRLLAILLLLGGPSNRVSSYLL